MPLSSAEPFFDVHVMKILCYEVDWKWGWRKIWAGREEGSASKQDKLRWRSDEYRMTPILIIDFWNQMLKTKQKIKGKKILLLPTVWTGDLSKNTSIPQSLITLGLHVHIHTIAFKSLNWRDRRVVQCISSVFCTSRCEPMPLCGDFFSEWRFRQPLNIGPGGLCTSLVLPVETRWGCVYCGYIHCEAPGPFISFFNEVDVVSEHKARPGNKRGKKVWADVVEWASPFCLWICTICFSGMFERELLYILMFMFVYMFAMTSAFSCTVAVSCFFFFYNFVFFYQEISS